MREMEIQCLTLEIGADSYARLPDGTLTTVRLRRIAIWLEPVMFLIKLLPMSIRAPLAMKAMQSGLEFEATEGE